MAFGPYLLLALMEGLVKAAVLALTAVGLSLVFGVMRVVNVAHGAFFMLGAAAGMRNVIRVATAAQKKVADDQAAKPEPPA